MGWTQYTPYFNDGEPCEFSIGSIGFFSQEELDLATEEEGELNGYYLEEYCMMARKTKLTPGLRDRLESFTGFIHEIEDFLESTFDTNCQVMIDMVKGELTVTEYDCGY